MWHVQLAPRTGRAIAPCVGERAEGPILLNRDATARLDRHAAARIVRRLAKRGGIDKRVTPHTLRHAFITAALDAGAPLRDVQEAASHADPRTTMRYDRGSGIPRPSRHLHRRHLPGRSDKVSPVDWGVVKPAAPRPISAG
ncbi:MAG TPA: tyrosine-type recombinase/integrase [Acidimicrobiia bacterium]|nr:tyrosine-type recombinase/integrase [Acidimicrobiia bacterium]